MGDHGCRTGDGRWTDDGERARAMEWLSECFCSVSGCGVVWFGMDWIRFSNNHRVVDRDRQGRAMEVQRKKKWKVGKCAQVKLCV